MEAIMLNVTALNSNPEGMVLAVIIALLVISGMVFLLLTSVKSISQLAATNILSKSPYLILGTIAQSMPGAPIYKSLKDIFNHKYILGNSGSGKSFNIIGQLLQLFDEHIGYSFIDPKDTWDYLLRTMMIRGDFDKEETFDRFILIQFRDDDHYLSWNILSNPLIKADVLANQIVEAFHRMWQTLGEGHAPLFDVIMNKALRVLIDNHLPITAAIKLLSPQQKKFREQCLKRVKDKDIVDWFHNVYDAWGREQANNVNSSLTRIDLLTNSDVLKYSLGQLENNLPIRQFMDEGKCVVFSLEGVQHPQARTLLGCLLALMYEYTALSREDIPEYERVPHFLYIDEFHDFSSNSSKSFETMLSKTRSYKLFLGLCHQQLDQASKRLLSAVQNCRVKMAGSAGREDAEILAKMFGVVDPNRILLEATTDKSQPVLMSKEWQWEEWTQIMQSLPPRHFMLKCGTDPAVVIKTIDVPTGQVDEKKLREIKARYRDRWFTRKDEIMLVHQLVDEDGNIQLPTTAAPPEGPAPAPPARPESVAGPGERVRAVRSRVVDDED